MNGMEQRDFWLFFKKRLSCHFPIDVLWNGNAVLYIQVSLASIAFTNIFFLYISVCVIKSEVSVLHQFYFGSPLVWCELIPDSFFVLNIFLLKSECDGFS